MLALGCDQAGYGLMQEVKKHLDKRGLKYVGCAYMLPKTPWIIRFTPKRW